MITALLFLAQAVDPAVTKAKPLEALRAAAPSSSTCDQPVIMVVAGPTRDRARMLAYGKAIAESRLYHQLGGYYLNAPQAVAQFEGSPPALPVPGERPRLLEQRGVPEADPAAAAKPFGWGLFCDSLPRSPLAR